MKKTILIALVVGILMLVESVVAEPKINEINFWPSSEIWVEEDLVIEVNCTNGSNVTATIIGSNYNISNIYFEGNNSKDLYTAKISSAYWKVGNFNYTGNFTVIIKCSDDQQNISIQTKNFTVSKFFVKISSISPSPIYLGDMIEISVWVKKETSTTSIPINSPDVKFNVTLDNQPVSFLSPPYASNRGWIILLNSSNITNYNKTHYLEITVFYDRVNATESTSFSIQEPIQFSIISVDKNWVKPNETINLRIQALDRGVVIPLTTENLKVKIGSKEATVLTITSSGNYYNTAILTPALSPGSYDVVATLLYKNNSYTASKPIDYIVPIFGRIVDGNGKGVSTRISFYSAGTEKLRLYTDSAGSYSGSLPPGTYDVEFVFPQSTLRLYDAEINKFEDPIKYYYFESVDVPGLNVAGLFVYETDLRYYKASIEMKYSEGNVLNENLLKVYKCEDWNSGRKECYGKWNEISASIDTIRNIVYVNTSSLSAYAIGTVKKLSVDFNINKQIFHLKDLVKVKGMVVDEDKNPVRNASVTVQIKNTPIKQKVFSDNNGLFTIEFLSPEEEGNYSLILTAEKYPYTSFNSNLSLQVVKSREVSLVFPDTIRVNVGENLTQEFSIVNIGQSDLYDLKISLEGVPKEYYSLQDRIDVLKIDEEKKLYVMFFIPTNASTGTLSGKIKVSNDEVYKEKVFGFTILEKNQTVVKVGAPAGFFGKIIPQIPFDPIYLLIFALVIFSLAFLLKKRKIRFEGRSEMKRFLIEVKEYLKRKENEKTTRPPESQQISIENEENYEKGVG